MAFLIGEMADFLSWGLGMAHALNKSDIVIDRYIKIMKAAHPFQESVKVAGPPAVMTPAVMR